MSVMPWSIVSHFSPVRRSLSFHALLRGGAQLKGVRQRGGGAQPEGERMKLSLVDGAASAALRHWRR